VVARTGGDEFAAVLMGCTGAGAAAVGERIRDAVRGISVAYANASISVGWALGRAGDDPLAVWRQADEHLYRAKRAGRDRVLGGRAAGEGQRVTAAEGLRRVEEVLRTREITAHYQPIVRLADGAIVGLEALARPAWAGPKESVEELFAAAQRTGRIRDLDWLCRRVALVGAPWPLPADCSVFVNVSALTLMDPVHGVDQMLLVLRAAGGSAEQVVLEITEHELISELDRLRLVLAAYREHGFRFALDDVGEGHSTLELLAAANPEFVKIARSLTAGSIHPPLRWAVQATMAFAEGSGATVIAEGVEDEETAGHIRDLGIPLAQGWHLGLPQPAASIRPLLRQRGPLRLVDGRGIHCA
ncbi:MAG TPA: EAL domain-containing protein, partial [Candidatus Dormibacteraeota bacterium]|nr:EAL domain-containing protein [Candidatus Dormibacteraeota bacterium]